MLDNVHTCFSVHLQTPRPPFSQAEEAAAPTPFDIHVITANSATWNVTLSADARRDQRIGCVR